MSNLPPKLYERLKKRGIIKDDNEPQSKKPCITESIKQSFIVNGCPNKYNEYHDCSSYCEKKYSSGMIEPTARIKKIYECLIENYPLEENWISVWESGCARFYFYNKLTNEVSWYPKGHPQFKTTKPINIIKGITDLNSSINLSANSNKQQTDNEKQLIEENKFTDELNQLDSELNENRDQGKFTDELNQLDRELNENGNEVNFTDELNQLDRELNENRDELNNFTDELDQLDKELNENVESDGSSQKSLSSDQEESSNED